MAKENLKAKISWHSEIRKISDLKLAAYNPRRMSERQEADLTNSLDKFSLAAPVVINKNNNIDLFEQFDAFGKKIDWKQFGNLAIERCQKYKKDFYIKKDLLDFVGTERLKPENFSPDFWALKK